jgi:hypothetical protein
MTTKQELVRGLGATIRSLEEQYPARSFGLGLPVRDAGIDLLQQVRDAVMALEEQPACVGHEPDEPERYDSLIRRYGETPVGLVAELAKKNQERRLMHEMFSAYGIREVTSENRELCLVARLAIALEELVGLSLPPAM